MHNGKRNYKIGGQRSLFGIAPKRERENEKYIPVPAHILTEWNKVLERSDKIRIARTQNLIASEITLAFRGHATIETINKINNYFEISRSNFKMNLL